MLHRSRRKRLTNLHDREPKEAPAVGGPGLPFPVPPQPIKFLRRTRMRPVKAPEFGDRAPKAVSVRFDKRLEFSEWMSTVQRRHPHSGMGLALAHGLDLLLGEVSLHLRQGLRLK